MLRMKSSGNRLHLSICYRLALGLRIPIQQSVHFSTFVYLFSFRAFWPGAKLLPGKGESYRFGQLLCNSDLTIMNIVITGASRGIGKAVAAKFAAAGYHLFLCARREKPLRELAGELVATHPGVQVHYRTCDVAKKEELRVFADWVKQTAPAVDVLVNNAGNFIQGQVYNEPDGVLEQLMETNVYSAYYLSRHLVGDMIGRRSGHIFNICSIASLKAYSQGGSYSITKYALAGLSANLRDELREFGIKVTAVFPGAAYTASWENSGVAADRIMRAEDIAEMIYAAAGLSSQACVEEIVIRPQLGDL